MHCTHIIYLYLLYHNCCSPLLAQNPTNLSLSAGGSSCTSHHMSSPYSGYWAVLYC